MPGSGDSIQALKAGIMEIPDVIAVNKKDRAGATTMEGEVRSILALDADREWETPIVLTDAITGEGVEELWDAVGAHTSHLEKSGLLAQRRASNLAGEVYALASGRAKAHLERAVAGDEDLRRLLELVERRELDPVSAVREIMQKVFRIEP
jgi:LAO/AO transport system kinase